MWRRRFPPLEFQRASMLSGRPFLTRGPPRTGKRKDFMPRCQEGHPLWKTVLKSKDVFGSPFPLDTSENRWYHGTIRGSRQDIGRNLDTSGAGVVGREGISLGL